MNMKTKMLRNNSIKLEFDNDRKKKKVSFKSKLAEIINVECWKKYNVDISENDEKIYKDNDDTKCNCEVF